LVTPDTDGHTVTFLPSSAPLNTSVTIGRPVFRSTPLAQFTLPKALAASSLPSLASSTYRKPLRLGCITTLRAVPPTLTLPMIGVCTAS
jgi:hypothetical protein